MSEKRNGKTKNGKTTNNKIASKQKSRGKKYKIKLNRSKFKNKQRNLFPSNGNVFQEYNCDMFRLTKAQSVGRTQLNRAIRVGKKVKLLQRYSLAAADNFTSAFQIMNDATSSGTTCRRNPLPALGKAIFETLRDCKKTVPEVCNTTKIESYNQSIENTIQECIPLLKKYGDDYKVSSYRCHRKTNLSFCVFSKSCSTYLEMTQEMCALVWDS